MPWDLHYSNNLVDVLKARLDPVTDCSSRHKRQSFQRRYAPYTAAVNRDLQ